jgi:hypothetical protein
LILKIRPYYFDLSGVLKLVLPSRQHVVHPLDIPVPSSRKKSLVLMKAELNAELNCVNEVWYY